MAAFDIHKIVNEYDDDEYLCTKHNSSFVAALDYKQTTLLSENNKIFTKILPTNSFTHKHYLLLSPEQDEPGFLITLTASSSTSLSTALNFYHPLIYIFRIHNVSPIHVTVTCLNQPQTGSKLSRCVSSALLPPIFKAKPKISDYFCPKIKKLITADKLIIFADNT